MYQSVFAIYAEGVIAHIQKNQLWCCPPFQRLGQALNKR